MKYFLDTYSLIEIAQGNPAYIELSKAQTVTLRDNVAELYYFLLRKSNEQAADFFFDLFLKITVDFPIQLVPKAMVFRLHHRNQRKYSYIDCFAYLYALQENIYFVTGDRAFDGLKNVKIIR